MAVYGISKYGADFYGYDLPPAYRIDPFVATSINYTDVLLTWMPPAGTIQAYRLVKNRFGFPVDQNDGELLIDEVNYPGNQFVDTSAEAGTFQYYGFFVLLDFETNTWVRSGWTACLAISDHSSGVQVNELIPDFYKQIPELSPTLPPAFPTTTLDFFCSVLGFGIDYLKTQYDVYLNVNDPWKISERDLYNLGTQLGININPDIHPYTLRKAIYNNAVVTQQRGTTAGIDQELEILTGFAADLQISGNFMLENDQSQPLNPQFLAWSPNINYNLNEYVSFGNFFYQCKTATNNIGNAPTGANTSNTWWNPVVSVAASSFINNLSTGHINTWETLIPSNSTGQNGTITELVGIQDPLNSANFKHSGFLFGNTSGSTTTVLARSISRVPGDITSNGPSFPPNKDQVVSDGIPVPFINNTLIWNGSTWNSSTRYGTDQIVTDNNVPFIALGASTGITPPVSSRITVNNQWLPVSQEPRFRLGISAYVASVTSGITVTPFVDWYDSNGNYITRVTARTASNNGTTSTPSGVVYDSFTYPYPPSASIDTRVTDDRQFSWTLRAGTFQLSPFSDGCVFPSSSARTYATVSSGVSNCQVGVTFVTAPNAGDLQGLILRWQDDNNYLRASMIGIDFKQAGSFSNLGVYSKPANAGDRLIVQMNGSTLTAFINGVQVLQVTSSFNTSGQIHGIISEGAVVVTNPGVQSGVVGQGV